MAKKTTTLSETKRQALKNRLGRYVKKTFVDGERMILQPASDDEVDAFLTGITPEVAIEIDKHRDEAEKHKKAHDRAKSEITKLKEANADLKKEVAALKKAVKTAPK